METVHWEKMYVTIDEETFEVEVPFELNYPTSVRLNGNEIPVVFSPLEGTLLWMLRSAGEKLSVTIQSNDMGLSVNANGWNYGVKVEDERTRRLRSVLHTGQQAVGSILVHAPMPGLVIRILKSTGDLIRKGEAYAILEAMKMENELRSSFDGTVTTIHVIPGQTVEKGALLITIEVEAV